MFRDPRGSPSCVDIAVAVRHRGRVRRTGASPIGVSRKASLRGLATATRESPAQLVYR